MTLPHLDTPPQLEPMGPCPVWTAWEPEARAGAFPRWRGCGRGRHGGEPYAFLRRDLGRACL